MAKQFSDFTFLDKRLSDMKYKYISVDFDKSDEIDLGAERDMVMGETNRYKYEPDVFYDTWSSPLEFELHITKDPCEYNNQTEMEFTKTEIRAFMKWLTSSHLPQWIKIVDEKGNPEDVRYYGWFSNIETFVAYGVVYGLKMHFKCTSSFAYTDVITNEIGVSTYKNVLIENDSDNLEDYCYPTIHITPNANGHIYICNLNDCSLLENGILKVSGNKTNIDALLDTAESYALKNDYTLEYTGKGAFNIVTICDDTACQFYLIDKYDNKKLCTIFYLPDTMEYKIIENGFMYMSVYKNLEVDIDCKKLTINDSLGRMITYDKLGLEDVGCMYFPQLISGNNSFILYGNATFKIKYIEARKVGE